MSPITDIISKIIKTAPVPDPHRAQYRSIVLIRRDTISQDLIVSYGVVSLSTTVAGIAFYRFSYQNRCYQFIMVSIILFSETDYYMYVV